MNKKTMEEMIDKLNSKDREIAETTKHYEEIIFLKDLKIAELQNILADISKGLDKLGDTVKEL